MTQVVNVKVAHIRPKYDNLREWMQDINNVYIGRKGVVLLDNLDTNKKERFPKTDSIWANPYKITATDTREIVISKYRAMIESKIKKDPALKQQLRELKGKTLGCWCKPEMCHGDVLVSIINET